jgi:microsomal dipeptidase-like Zn-dependent dipeptidase
MNIFRISLLLLLSATLPAQTVTPQARAIHNSAIVVDTHADTPQRCLYENFDIGNQLKAAGKSITYFDKDQIEREWAAKLPRPPLRSLIDHIDHIAKVAGVDHVGLGSDFDGVSGAMLEGIDSAADLPKITQALMDRGYSEKDIHKILGGNLLRVFGDVERVSREMQAEAARTSTSQ